MKIYKKMKRIKAEDYLPTEIENFILDCKEEDRNSVCPARDQDAVNLEIIWRMNFYRHWTEKYIEKLTLEKEKLDSKKLKHTKENDRWFMLEDLAKQLLNNIKINNEYK